MASGIGAKRKRDGGSRSKHQLPRKSKKVAQYHSSSEEEEEEEEPVEAGDEVILEDGSEHSEDDDIDLPNLRDIITAKGNELNNDAEAEDDEEVDSPNGSEDDDQDAEEETADTTKQRRKRNDPFKLATSISSILNAKLTTTQRSDPILSRSAAAAATSKEVSESKLDAKARRKLRDEKRTAKERGRVKDVLGLDDTTVSTAAVAEQEKRLRKTAQRGVVKLFNAVRAAQVKGEDAAREAGALVAGGTQTAVVGTDRRKERVTEMSKKGFLDLLAGGGAV